MNERIIRALKETGRMDEYYGMMVTKLIRERYSIDDELAILRQRDTKPEEFDIYNKYAEECKAAVKSKLL